MDSRFINKKIIFFGDSLTEHGQYINNLRSFFHDFKQKAYVFNKGVGGNRSIHAKEILYNEVIAEKPDIVFISFGVNDVGVWLYDCGTVFSPDIIKQRKERDEIFYEGILFTVEALKKEGIYPIVMTPFAVDANIEENVNIKTLTDNEEKERLDSSFYKKSTFENINNALSLYSDELIKLSHNVGFEVFDMYSKTFELMKKKDGLFLADGIHYSDVGFEEISKIIIGYFGADPPKSFQKYETNDTIFQLERKERGVQAALSLKYKSDLIKKDDDDFINQMKQFAEFGADDEYFVHCAKVFMENYKDYSLLKEKIKQLTVSFIEGNN